MSIDVRDPGKSCYSEGKIKPLNVVSVSKWLEQQLATNIVVNINSTFLGMKFAEVLHCPYLEGSFNQSGGFLLSRLTDIFQSDLFLA